MAIGKKNSKTSKTAHVLNVITGAGTDAPVPVSDTASDSIPEHPVAPILEVAHVNDSALADTILEALKAETEREDTAEPEKPVLQAQEPEMQSSKIHSASQSAPISGSSPVKLASSQTGSPLPQENADPGKQRYYNVIQALVEDKAAKYMQMLEMCMCPRCQADVKALALSNLSPKYIVMQSSEITPMLSVYEGKFGSAVTAQILSACQIVRDNPRHPKAQ